MKIKYTSRLLIGAATLSLATFMSQGTANASEQTSSLAAAQPVSYESTNVSPDQKAFYQVLHMNGISESQRDQYIKQLHEDPNSAQNVFSESIKDAKNPERRVAQQNAFYSVLHNEDLSDQQRDAYISEIRENADQSQEVFVKSLNTTTNAEQQPKAPHNRILEMEDQSIYDANDALKALKKEDTIQNRRAAQRAVNKLPQHKVNAFQTELDKINAPRDAKIKADAEAKQQGLQIGESPNIEKTPVPIEDTPKVEKKEEHKAESDSKAKETPKADAEKKADTEKKPQAEKAPKVEAPKVENEAKETPKTEKTPKVEDKKQTDKVAETKEAKPSKEVQPSTETKPEAKNNADSGLVTPVLPETGEATTSTLSSYWNAFKDGVYNGYTYLKDGVTKGLDYLKGQYNYITGKYNEAKYYTNIYSKYKSTIDKSVLALLGKNGSSAYIEPLKIDATANPLYSSYAHTRNLVTESINTGKVLHALYQNPTVVKTAIKAAETANAIKNVFNSIFSIFK